MAFSFFKKHNAVPAAEKHTGTPAIRCSICTGEQVAGFRHEEALRAHRRDRKVLLTRRPFPG